MGDEAVEFLQGKLGYTDVLAANGYRCGLSGKWHLGDSIRPQKSFTHWYAHQRGGGKYYGALMIRDGQPYNEKKYVTEAITDEALEVIDAWNGTDDPFYLSVHYTAPHSPWINNHPKEIVDSYEDCPFDTCPQSEPHPQCNPLTMEVSRNPRENLKGYFAAITAMDANIGRILDRIEALGIANNTLVIYLSDNGFSCGQHGFWGKGNGTFPFNMFDHSVKVPAIFSHPGRIPAGQVSTELVSAYDIFPTLLEYAGIDHPCAEELPGSSFVSLLEGDGELEREPVVVFDEYGPVRMIRNKEWKYVRRYPYGPNELYDMVNDPGELTNLYGLEEHNEIKREMKSALENWFHRYVDPALDGTHEAVGGRGQHSLVGPAGNGGEPFMKAFVRGGKGTT
jgi:arylsulfatase A-like enzyme